tara:strand:- start:25 stop:258 length:234 start_codon:yes stop_codon:yes gene_type:complete
VVLGERRTGEKGSSSSPLLRLFLSSFNVIANMMKKARADSSKGERKDRSLIFLFRFVSGKGKREEKNKDRHILEFRV